MINWAINQGHFFHQLWFNLDLLKDIYKEKWGLNQQKMAKITFEMHYDIWRLVSG